MLYFIVVEPPPSFFRGPSIFAVFQVMVVVFRLLLNGWAWEHWENAETDWTESHRRRPWIIQNIQANMTVAVNMRMEWSWMLKDNLWSFHRIMLRKFHLKLVSFIGIKGSWSSIHFNNPSLEIIRDSVLETSRRISLPLHELFLQSIGGDFCQTLTKKNERWSSQKDI